MLYVEVFALHMAVLINSLDRPKLVRLHIKIVQMRATVMLLDIN